MKIFKALGSGFLRSVKIWKGVLIVWLMTFLLVSLVTFPIKTTLKTGIGFSMISEKLQDGLDIEVLSDLVPYFKSISASLIKGFLLLALFGTVVNAFLTGGLFNNMKMPLQKFSVSEFFRTSAKNFWTFLIISLIISSIILLLGFILGITIRTIARGDPPSEATPYIVAITGGTILAVIKIILLLVADYARAWQVRNENQSCFRAIGFGFSRTFRKFLSSFPLMLILIVVSMLFMFLVIKLLGPWKPATSGGIFLMFILSQIMFLINLLIKTWRYGSVTSLMEQTDPEPDQAFVNIQ